ACIELFLLRLGELDGDPLGLPFRVAVDVFDEAIVQVILGSEPEALCFRILPTRRAQVAQRPLALSAVERGHLAELQPITFACGREIVDDAALHGFERALAPRI